MLYKSFTQLPQVDGALLVLNTLLCISNNAVCSLADIKVLFTLKNTVTSNRVYKVETISYAEDGLVEISGSHAPLTDSGSLAILDGWSGVLNHFMELI